MKKSIFIFSMLSLVMLFVACNKDKKANKCLDKKWYALTLDGGAIANGDTVSLDFTKNGKTTGSVVIDQRFNSLGIFLNYSASYSIEDEVITFTTTNPDVEPTTVYEIVKCSKTELELKKSNGQISTFKSAE